MKKRILALFLAVLTLASLLVLPAGAAPTLEEAMAEVDVYARNAPLAWLTMNGSVKTQYFTYYLYESPITGQLKEIPAYCVDPRLDGVPKAVPEGTAVKYSAESTVSDEKIAAIIANGYPHMTLADLGLESVEEAYYATKTALWCYLRSDWSVDQLGINPGADQSAAQRVLQAVRDIYWRGLNWEISLTPRLTAQPDRDTAYLVTANGQDYYQQIFTITSDTWPEGQEIFVSLEGDFPAGTQLLDADGNPVTKVVVDSNGEGGFQATAIVRYPTASVEGQSGTVRLVMQANVVQYAIYYAKCLETDQYGNLQHYMLDTDPLTPMDGTAISSYVAESTPDAPVTPTPTSTALKIVKLEEGTNTPLAGAVFRVTDPNGRVMGSFSTGRDGTVTIPCTMTGHHTVEEIIPPKWHTLSANSTQHVQVNHGEVSTVTFTNPPYGNLRVEKVSDTGEKLPGVTVQIKHITTGATQTAQTGPGGAVTFTELLPGGYEVREIAGIPGWQADTETVQTVAVVSGETSTVTFTNKELPGLRIVKYDRTTLETMADVTFEIWRDGESLGHFQTDELGEIVLLDAQPGTYLVREVQSDNAHITETTPQQVELRAGDGIKQLVFFNDLKPGIHLIKVDSANLSKPLPNAVFEIRSVAGDFGPEEFTTDENGEIDLSRLPVGAYVVTEKSCPGYIVDEAQRIIQLDGNETAQFVFTNSVKPSLYLKKLSADGTPLAGVSFRLAKIEDGTFYLDRTTNEQGEILWEGLEPGVYSLVETATVADHILDRTEYHVELFPGKTSEKVIQNDRRPNLIVYKHDADTGEPIPGTIFTVRAADGHSVDEIRTDENGQAVLENLLPGVYEVSEKSVPAPWLMDAPSQLVTLYPNRDHTVYFENHKKPTLTINKVDSITGSPIQGAKFQVWYASNNTSTGELNDLGYFYSDENGQFFIDLLRDGWYKVTELEPADGYTIKEPITQELYISGGESKTITFENVPKSAIIIEKYDSVTGAALPGCTFQLKYLGGTSGTGGTVIGTKVTGVNGTAIWTGLAPGVYVVKEVSAADGYNIIQSSETVYLADNGEQSVITIRFTNAPDGQLLIRKVCSVNPSVTLQNAEFKVTYADGTVIGDSNGVFRTDENGEILITGLTPGKSVVVMETRAPDGFILDTQSQTVQIKEGRIMSLTFKNQPKGAIIIQKRDSATGLLLSGAQFRVTTAAGCEVGLDGVIGTSTLTQNGIFTTDSNGEIKITNLAPGAYVLTEIKAPDGYVIDTPSTNVVIGQGGDTQTIVIKNTPVGSLTIIKKDEETGERISGVQFEIRKLNGEIVGTYTTDENGVINLPEAEKGWYQVVELKAAKGYKLDSTPHQIEVKDGQTATLEITNRQARSALIHKIDSVTGKGIFGVKFLLSDAKGNPIGVYESDNEGYVYIGKELADGKYTIREIECAEGYIPDTQPKTIYVEYGGCTTITWKNTAITGQIQITKTSADYNSMNGWPAGTPIPGTVFEIYNYRTGNLVDTIRTDKNGVAVSKPLPLGRYKVVESQAADFYALDKTPIDVEIEHAGQIVKAAMTNRSLYTNVSIQKTGYVEVMPGQNIRYTFSNIGNNSNVSLSSFFWRDTLPTQAVRLDRIVTGTYNVYGNYKIVYRTNLSGGEYRVLADSLNTQQNYVLDASPTALGLAANEYVTEFMAVFGTVPAGFRQVEAPRVYCTVLAGLAGGTQFSNQADVGGVYDGQWVMAVSRWVTRVYAPALPLPRTGF